MEFRMPKRTGALTLALALLGGCAGNGAGLDQSGRPVTPGGGTAGPLTADFASIQSHIFTPICTACHAGGGAPQGLRLDSTNSFALLVGIPSTEVSSVLRVKPGDPDNSYLIQKLEGHAAIGARMPFGGPYLDQATIDVVRQWIHDGALQGTAAAVNVTALAVRSVSPMTNDVRTDTQAPLVVGLSEEIDQTRIDAGSVRLELVDPATGIATGSIPLRLYVPAGNPATVLVTPAVPLTIGAYRLSVPPPPETGLSGISGARLGVAGDTSGPIVLSEFAVETQP